MTIPIRQSVEINSVRGMRAEPQKRRLVPEEVPIAISYNGSSHAVLMATPVDLLDFAAGFSLTEGIVSEMSQIERVEVLEVEHGYDLQVFLAQDADARLRQRRRAMVGPVGCGLCGIDSIEQAIRPLPDLSKIETKLVYDDIIVATGELYQSQRLHQQTRAVHAAGLYAPGLGLAAAREDVGRHNALDKLCGFALRSSIEACASAVVVTSRISVEMVQKTAMLGSAVLIAVSCPTALAIRTADAAGITLIGLARGDDFEIFSHSRRITAK